MSTDRPSSVLFVCVRNSGKSQMAAGIARQLAPDVSVVSAGTDPGEVLNPLAVATLAEVGADLAGEYPKPITPDLVAAADVIVILGHEARLEPTDGTPVLIWDTDEPSLRGIEGPERLRLIRDDITDRVRMLLDV